MSQTAMNLEPTTNSTPAQGGRLVAPDGRTLPLRGAHIAAECAGGIGRVVLTQRFVNPYAEPLRVTYLLPLPSDGAVAGFAFRIGDRRIVGEVDRRESARERFEQALVEGRTAALLEQDRSSLFTQEVGNIPPRAEVEVEIELDQRLRWLDEGAWEWRFPTVVGPRYMGAEGRVGDADRVTVDIAERGIGARMGLALTIGDAIGERPIESPSHALIVDRGARSRVAFDEGAALDRDVVNRWPVAPPEVGASLELARPASPSHDGKAYGLLTLVPPAVTPRALDRDLIFLIDVSGSMGGEPLDQLERVAAAMIDTLGEGDRVELIAFGSAPVRFAKEPIAATRDGKRAALKWLRGLTASGATEMTKAVIEALRPLRPGSQRQVVLMTDGYIGFERELVREVRARLPEGARLHTVGVGSAVNRTLTQWAARAGGGVEVICGLGEDPERVAQRLLARTTSPIVTDVSIEGGALLETAAVRLPDLYAGSPSLIPVALDPKGGTLTIRGRTARGEHVERIEVPAITSGTGLAAVTTLFGRERVEDLETLAAAGDAQDVDREIESVGIRFQIATRMTSWIAVSDDVTVDPDAEKRSVRQPHELPQGLSIEGLGLRAASAPMMQAMAMASAPMMAPGAPMMMGAPPPPPAPVAPASAGRGAPPAPKRARRMAASEPAPEAKKEAAPAAERAMPAIMDEEREERRDITGAHPAIQASKIALPAKKPRKLWIVLVVLAIIAAVVAAWLALASSEPRSEAPQERSEAPARE